MNDINKKRITTGFELVERIRPRLTTVRIKKGALYFLTALILVLSGYILISSNRGKYLKDQFDPIRTDMFHLLVILIIMLIIRHLLKNHLQPYARPYYLNRFVGEKSWMALTLILIFISAFYLMYKNSVPPQKADLLRYDYVITLMGDGDLDFTNQSEQHPDLPYVKRQDGTVINPEQIGAGIIWIPSFIIAQKIDEPNPDIVQYHAEYPYLFAARLSNLVLSWIGLIILIVTLRKFVDDKSAFFTGIITWIATPLLCFTIFRSTSSYGIIFFLASLYLLLLKMIYENPNTQKSLSLGLAVGTLMMIDSSLAVLLLLPVLKFVVDLFRTIRKKNKYTPNMYFKWAFSFGAFAFTAMIPHLIIASLWKRELINLKFAGEKASLCRILCTPGEGLLIWSPILLIAIAGIITFTIKNRVEGLGILFSIAIIGAAGYWFAGLSTEIPMGPFVIIIIPFLAIGIGFFLHILWDKKIKILNYASIVLLILLFFWNIAITGFQTNPDELDLLTKQKSIFSIYTGKFLESIAVVPVYLIRAPGIFFNPHDSWHYYNIRLHKHGDHIPIESGEQFLGSGWNKVSFNNLSSEFYTTCIQDISRINFILDEPEKLRFEFDISAMDDTKIIIPVINEKALNPELLMIGRQSVIIDIEADQLKKGINTLQFDSYNKIPFFSETKSEPSPGYFFHLYSISYNFPQDKAETE